jgi:hypothetical protein
MLASVVGGTMDETVSLYLDLHEGEKANLEVVARAAIAFSRAIKETAFVLDPGIDVQVDFISGTESSLSLNTRLRALAKAAKPKRASLLAIAVAVIVQFGPDIRAYTVGKLIDRVLLPEQRRTLTPEDLKEIERLIEKSIKGRVAEEPVRQVYRELGRDPAISGVGATAQPGKRPPDIVPRDEFPARSGDSALIVIEQPRSRKKTSLERLTLISPVLLQKERAWKFYLPELGEFWAYVRDEAFRESLVSGRRKIQMRAGIQMRVLLETHETKEGEIWRLKERVISKVLRVTPPAKKTLDLLSSLPEENHENETGVTKKLRPAS